MIDFSKNPFLKLSAVDQESAIAREIAPIINNNEKIHCVFAGGRDGVLFTDRRIIVLNVQGLTGAKKDFTSIPYSKIQVFSIETAGTFDRDAEVEIYISGLGKVKFEFSRGTDMGELSRVISYYVLK